MGASFDRVGDFGVQLSWQGAPMADRPGVCGRAGAQPVRFASNDPLDPCVETRHVTPLFRDMKVCHITGSRATRGSVIHRRGLAKKKGGVGRHITKMVPRIFAPNLHRQRVWVPELKKFVRVRVTARGLKTINKQGAYKALKKAGAI
jgi:large subunit ribosomal protein L28